MLTPAESKAQRLYALALVFYFVSFIGWCGETLLFLVRFGRLRDRGFLTLPFCTIYGSCLTGMYLFAGTPQNGRLAPLFAKAEGLRGAARPAAKCGLYALYFLCAALLPTLAELAFGGLFSAFGVRLWDYGYKKVHLYGLISPDQSLLWGALITLATLALTLPAGLCGTPALEVANWLSQHMPLVQLLNPAVQATEAMLSLTFYDSLAPFASACGALLAIAALLGAGALIFMRRQRYVCA